MKLRLMFFAALIAAVLSVSLAASSAIGASVVYNAIPSLLPPNVTSLGFEAQSTSEFGDYVHLTNTNPNRVLNAVTVTMSDWALYSDYSTDDRYSGDSSTWSHPITVNVYSNHLTGGVPDELLATKTQNVTIPWRPVADVSCGTAWKASNGNCYNGLAFNATFDLSSLNKALPDDVIVGVAYNTADYGQAPIHMPGPYNSLNVGVPNGQTANVGTDDNANNVFWNTSYAPFYADGGVPGGVGIFRQDTNWAPYGTVAIQITASAACTPTGFSRDGHDLTAAQIGGNVAGTLDATGCDIGVYYKSSHTGTVMPGADISGAKYFGVLVNGVAADVTGSSVHNIGDVPFNGSQHGNAIVYLNGASGTISGNHVYSYQKNGITVSGVDANGVVPASPTTSASVLKNIVTGEGPVSYIAQNGIQVSYGASGTVTGNTVSNNWYTGASYTACGLLFYQAGGVKQNANNLFNNQTNFCNFGRGGGKPPRP